MGTSSGWRATAGPAWRVVSTRTTVSAESARRGARRRGHCSARSAGAGAVRGRGSVGPDRSPATPGRAASLKGVMQNLDVGAPSASIIVHPPAGLYAALRVAAAFRAAALRTAGPFVATALLAAALRAAAPRRRAACRVCAASAGRDAARWPSRLSARTIARERVREGLRWRRAARDA
jgi:hypothetical protein